MEKEYEPFAPTFEGDNCEIQVDPQKFTWYQDGDGDRWNYSEGGDDVRINNFFDLLFRFFFIFHFFFFSSKNPIMTTTIIETKDQKRHF